MPEAKIEIKIGDLHFSAEAEQQWVASQLDKIIAKADVLGKLAEKHAQEADDNKEISVKTGNVPHLAAFLNSKGANVVQVKKFLGTAAWLYLKGRKKMTTAEVAKVLKDNHQARLGNPADCLNQNVGKGFCEKDGNEFFITEDGFKGLGMLGA